MATATSSSGGWKDELLKEVKWVPKAGEPGIIEVFGDQAEGILLDDRGRAVMAAATYGSGRIVAFGHNGYVKHFREGKNKNFFSLNRNIRNWLGITEEGGDVTYGDSLKVVEDIPKSGVLVVAGGGDKLKKFVPGILKFIQEGGGFVCGVCPWGWLEKRPQETIDGMALQQIVKEAGMSFTGEKCEFTVVQEKEKSENAADVKPGAAKKQAADTAQSTPDKCVEKRIEKPVEMCASPTMAAAATSPSGSWKKELLKEVKWVPKAGEPGIIEVFGDQAEGIVLDDRGRAVMAAATYGSGRIVAFGHNGYVKHFREGKNKNFFNLNRNIRNWLGITEEGGDVTYGDNLKGVEDIPKSGVLVVAGGGDKLKKFVPGILKFIQEGGGFVCGVCPWGWLEKRPQETIDGMALQQIVKEAGMSFTGEKCEVKKTFVVQDKEKPGAAKKQAADIAQSTPDKCVEKRVEKPVEMCSSPTMAAASPSGSWKDELLKDVTTVPKVGVPGLIVVFGDQAEPILLDDRGRAIMAAATYGSGRVVAFSHNGYIKQFREGKNQKFENLNRNIRTWLGMNEGDDVTDAANIKEAADIPKSGVLFVAGGGDKGKKLVPDVLKFIKEGGGLLCGVCPWGWLQKRPRKTIDDMVLQGIVNEVGLSFTAETCAAKKEISAAESKEKAEVSHLGRALRAIDLDPDSVEKYAETVAQNAQSIPDKCFEKRLNTPMEKCYEKCIKQHKDCIPKGGKKKVKDSRGRAVVSLTTGFLEKQAKMGKEVKAPGINDFPGDFEEEPQLQCASVIIKSARKERHSTGYYLPAGKVLTIKATTTGEHVEDWRVRVGAHSDNLSGKKEFKRWPKLSVVKRLEAEAETKISSPYGGLIYFESPKEAGDLTASMENVVEAPYYDLEDPRSVQNWSERRKAPGLWADLAGEHIIFTLPAASVRELEDPSEGLRAWDDVVKAHHELRGTNPSGGHRQRIVPDRQPKAGWMHAGYPIVTNMDIAQKDKFILDGKKLRKAGNWGLFHELGHNMQRKAWTFEGTGEVTCNVFTLHAMHVVAKRDPWQHPWVRNKWPSIEQFFKDGAPHDVWKKKAGVALAVYAQLAHHFGWEPYKKVFRQYEKDPKKKEPQNNKERIVLWIVRFSKEAGRNLVPLFDFWGFPHTEEAQAQVSGLEAFLPDDDLTALAPERLAEIRGKYNMQK